MLWKTTCINKNEVMNLYYTSHSKRTDRIDYIKKLKMKGRNIYHKLSKIHCGFYDCSALWFFNIYSNFLP